MRTGNAGPSVGRGRGDCGPREGGEPATNVHTIRTVNKALPPVFVHGSNSRSHAETQRRGERKNKRKPHTESTESTESKIRELQTDAIPAASTFFLLFLR
jgi:hypothetical protein